MNWSIERAWRRAESRAGGISRTLLAASVAALALSGLLIPPAPALAAPGALDPTFGSGGFVLDGPPGRFDAAVLQPDGKIVVADIGPNPVTADSV